MLVAIDGSCPLTPCQRRLLQACLDLDTTETGVLARSLHLSRETVFTDFKRISAVLNTNGRGGALIVALKRGWLTLPPPATGKD